MVQKLQLALSLCTCYLLKAFGLISLSDGVINCTFLSVSDCVDTVFDWMFRRAFCVAICVRH